MSRPKAVTYDEWRRGSSGSSDKEKTDYNGMNVQVYANGTLGPRPGWVEWTEAGTPGFDEQNDDLLGFLWHQDAVGDNELLFVYDDGGTIDVQPAAVLAGTYTLDTGLTISPALTTPTDLHNAAFAAGDAGQADHDTIDSVFLLGHVLTGWDISAGTITAQIRANTADGVATRCTPYRDRMYYWGISAEPGRIYYSNLADYTTVAASSFFDTGYAADLPSAAIVGVYSIENALLLARIDGTWLVLTGADPEVGSFRELGHDPVPETLSAASVDNALYYLRPSGRGICIATPSRIDTRTLRHLAPKAYPGSTADISVPGDVQPLQGLGDDIDGSVILPYFPVGLGSDVYALESVNDVWNYSKWDLTGSPTWHVILTKGNYNRIWAIQDAGTGPSRDWRVFSREVTLDRPGRTADSFTTTLTAEADTAVPMRVDLRTIVAADDTIISPTKVVLDIDYWKDTGTNGYYQDPSITVDVTVNGVDAATSTDSAAQQTIASTSWDDGLRVHRRVSVPIPKVQWGQAIDVTIGGDGFAIDRVRVYYDEQDDVR